MLSDGDALAAIRHGQLPDGSRFDPRTTAIVSADDGEVESPRANGSSSVKVEEIVDGRITMNASSDAGGILVLSESYYPGWRARVDGAVAPVRRVDFMLQGVQLSPGRHTVVFEFGSLALRAGTALSASGVVLCALLMLTAGSPRNTPQKRPRSH